MFTRQQDKNSNHPVNREENRGNGNGGNGGNGGNNRTNGQPTCEIIKGGDLEEDKMDINAIPDIELLSSKGVEFLEFYDEPQIVKLRKENHSHYLFKLYERFEMIPLSMIKLLSEPNHKLRTQNVEKIIMLLERLAEVKAGTRNLEATRDEFLEENNEKYFYPAFGGKEQLIKLAEEKGEKY
jgi:hypothetical protein